MIKFMFCAFVIIQFVLLQNVTGQAGGISSKLDFGSDSSTTDYDSTLSTSLVKALVSLRQSSGPSKSIISSKLDESPFNIRSAARSTQPKTDFSTLGVICVDGKCNTTEATQNTKQNTGDNLSTDILVQVVTNVKDENKTKVTDDTDVPVIVGYSGTNVKNSDFDLTNRRIDKPDVKIQAGKNDERNFYHIGNEVRPDSHQHEVPYFNPNFNNHYFGESPPPQFVWYRRRNNGYANQNPSMYRPISRPYKQPWHWQLKYAAAPTVTPEGWTTTTQCSCSNPGLKWYPSFGPNQPSPSPSVNDKIAPLN